MSMNPPPAPWKVPLAGERFSGSTGFAPGNVGNSAGGLLFAARSAGMPPPGTHFEELLQFSQAWNGDGGENANANKHRAVDQKGAIGTEHCGESSHLQMTKRRRTDGKHPKTHRPAAEMIGDARAASCSG